MKKTWRKLRDKIKSNKKTVVLSCVLVFAVGLLICGLSIAFFSGRDAVTNKATSKEITIKLFEPDWQETGKAKASKMEPGMTIEKDPYIYNASEDDVYVRMKIVIKTVDDDGKYVEIDPDSDATIYYAIMSAIYCQIESTEVTDVPLVTKNGSTYSYTNPAGFIRDDDGWYYYKDGQGYTSLAPGESTECLFYYLKLPVLKSEYNGIFDSGFQIEVIAQAVSATTYQDKDEATIKGAFDNDFTQVSSETASETTSEVSTETASETTSGN